MKQFIKGIFKTLFSAKTMLFCFIAAFLFLMFLAPFLLSSCTEEVVYVPKPQRPIPQEYMSEKESRMIAITNEYRVAQELYLYKTSLDLYHLAKGRVYYMAETDSLSHYGFYPAYEESEALFYGESISYGFETAESNILAFKASENHWPMFISPIYEYIAIACEGRYTVVLVARWRPYRVDGKRALEIVEIRSGNISISEVKP